MYPSILMPVLKDVTTVIYRSTMDRRVSHVQYCTIYLLLFPKLVGVSEKRGKFCHVVNYLWRLPIILIVIVSADL